MFLAFTLFVLLHCAHSLPFSIYNLASVDLTRCAASPSVCRFDISLALLVSRQISINVYYPPATLGTVRSHFETPYQYT